MKEIGSYFWLEDQPNNSNDIYPEWLKIGIDNVLLVSGRNSIDFVINDISLDIKSVYMPSYCCDSMLQPFIKKGIKICFYDVMVEEKELSYSIDKDLKCDIFFAMSYFGYTSTAMDGYIDYFRDNHTIVIEDITHRLLCDKKHGKSSHYLVASLHKWFPIASGGLASKMDGHFSENKTIDSNDFATNKIEAMKLKKNYINSKYSDEISKKNYLNMYRHFNLSLNDTRGFYSIDNFSKNILFNLDIQKIISIRKKNVDYLLKKLKKIKYIELLIDDYNYQEDCLLFLPIKISDSIRNKLVDYLRDNNVYLPVHWLLPSILKDNIKVQQIYLTEISIVCDHRYSVKDMKNIIKLLKKFGVKND